MSRELSRNQARKKSACTDCLILDNYHSTEQPDKKNIYYYYENEMEIELILCKSSSISYPIHNHVSVFTIGLILDGLIILKIRNTAKYYYKNEVFVIPPYVPHEIIACGNYSLLNCCINKHSVTSIPLPLLKQNLLSLFDISIFHKGVSKKQSALLMELLYAIPHRSNNINNLEPKLQELLRQIEKYPEKQLTIDDMAITVYTSKYYFIRKFKDEIGLTPHQFILQNRLRKAQHLLCNNNSITEVALITGFSDQSHFIRNFEKMTGLTPSEYKTAFTSISKKSPNYTRAGINLANK